MVRQAYHALPGSWSGRKLVVPMQVMGQAGVRALPFAAVPPPGAGRAKPPGWRWRRPKRRTSSNQGESARELLVNNPSLDLLNSAHPDKVFSTPLQRAQRTHPMTKPWILFGLTWTFMVLLVFSRAIAPAHPVAAPAILLAGAPSVGLRATVHRAGVVVHGERPMEILHRPQSRGSSRISRGCCRPLLGAAQRFRGRRLDHLFSRQAARGSAHASGHGYARKQAAAAVAHLRVGCATCLPRA